MNTKPYISSQNKRIIILIYTKDCSDTEGYKKQTNFVAEKMAVSSLTRHNANNDQTPAGGAVTCNQQ